MHMAMGKEYQITQKSGNCDIIHKVVHSNMDPYNINPKIIDELNFLVCMQVSGEGQLIQNSSD